MTKLLIVGLGPAGLGALMALAEAEREGFLIEGRDYELEVLEGQAKVGQKLLLTGGGRCNLTHEGTLQDFVRHYFEGGKFLYPSLQALSPEMLREKLRCQGLETYAEKGRVFPVTNQAKDVLEALLSFVSPVLDGNLQLQSKVTALERTKDERWLLRLQTGETLTADHLLLATGGASVPQTGSDGTMHEILKTLGVPMTTLKPALVALLSPHSLKDLSGLSFPARFQLKPDQRRSKRENKVHAGEGTILITEDGFSGPELLNRSRTLNGAGGTLELELFPDLSPKPYRQAKHKEGLRTLLHAQYPDIPDRLIKRLLQFVQAEHMRAPFDPTELQSKLDALSRLTFRIDGPEPITKARITRGGVDLKAVDPQSMEIKGFPGLYVAGELLDIDGESGGYNLQAAFSTGYLAGQSLIAKLL